eukprot:PhF_6_TR5718/c0_g1_i1/m.8426
MYERVLSISSILFMLFYIQGASNTVIEVNNEILGTTFTMVDHCDTEATTRRTVMLVFPGGGYRKLAFHEGHSVCKFLVRNRGYCCFVVQYTTQPANHTAPLTDATAAVEYVHEKFPWRPICAIGFSAGGHAVGILAAHGHHPLHCIGMVYPVVTFNPEWTHKGSTSYLLGKQMNNETLQAYYSIERHITSCFPPTFYVHSMMDKTVKVKNSYLLEEALTRAGVPHEGHIFSQGSHGYGLALRAHGDFKSWPNKLLTWLDK